MDSKEYRNKNEIFYVIYIIANIFTFGSFWFATNLIAYAISKSNDK
ncbi:MAG: hypothetical protein PHT94_01790 [Candidatus Nanoarchaeia archaeon]|nr:hypothetical protein [Candidatus Nanoarchaeia archaeon]